MKYSGRMLVFALLLSALSPPARAAVKSPFPMMENYTGAGRLDAFANDAVAFVRKNPKSPHAPRVMFDTYLAATLGGKAELAKGCKIILLQHYGASPYGRHVLESFKDGLEYKNFADKSLFTGLAKVTDERARSLIAGLKFALERFGYKHITGRFALECILLARQAGADDLAGKIAAGIRNDKSGQSDKFTDLCLREDIKPLDRILKLNEMIAHRGAPEVIGYFVRCLPQAQRSDPRIVRIGIQVDVCTKRFAEALKTIDTLSGKELDSQILYWRGRCLLAAGNRPGALKALKLAHEIDPKSPWRETSARLAACIEGYGKNMLAGADMLLACSKKFRAEAEVIEVELVIEAGESKTRYRVYFSVIIADETVEIVLFRNDKVFVAYKSAPDGMRLYSSGSNEIVRFPKVQLVPMFAASVTREPTGGFNTFVGFNMGKSLQQSIKANQQAWNSPYLTTRAGLLDYRCSEAVRAGQMPASITRKGRTTVLKWTLFGTNEPETSDFELHVNDANELTAIRSDLFQTRKIRYGRKSEMKLSSPKWPDVKVRTAGKTEIPFAAFGSLLAEFMNVADELNKDK